MSLLELKHDGNGRPHVIRLSVAARNALLDYMNEIEPQLTASGRLGGVTDWASKLVGAVARIAGIMHTLDHGAELADAPVPLGTMQQAIEIGRYATEHAIAAHGEMGADPAAAAARWLLDHLRRKSSGSFTVRGMFSDVTRGRFQNVNQLEQAISVLADRGYVRRRVDPPRHGAGRPPSPTYEVHPGLLSADSADSAAEVGGAGDVGKREVTAEMVSQSSDAISAESAESHARPLLSAPAGALTPVRQRSADQPFVSLGSEGAPFQGTMREDVQP